MYVVVDTYCKLCADDYGIKSTKPLKVTKHNNTKVGVKLWNVQFVLSLGVTMNYFEI
jgi:hypothetical protein